MNNLASRYGNTPSDAYRHQGNASDHAVTFDGGHARAIRVATAGDLELTTYAGNNVVIAGVAAGETVELVFSAIVAAGTTADDFTLFR